MNDILRNLHDIRDIVDETLDLIEARQKKEPALTDEEKKKIARLNHRRAELIHKLEKNEWIGFEDWLDIDDIKYAPENPEYWIEIAYLSEDVYDKNGCLKLAEVLKFEFSEKDMTFYEIDGDKSIDLCEYVEQPEWFKACEEYYPKKITRAW